ncbi:MAG: hypothetical protein WA901_16490 [Phormidesmis sp.]
MNILPETFFTHSVVDHTDDSIYDNPPNSCRSAQSTRSLARSAPTAVAFLLLSSGLSVLGIALDTEIAIAQTTTQLPSTSHLVHDAASGSVYIDNNAFDIQTGILDNTSAIPLPTQLPIDIKEGVSQPVTRDRLAPNTVELSPDLDYIDRALTQAISSQSGQYELETDSLQFTTQFNLRQSHRNHRFAEGIEVTVFDEGGNVVSRESTFVSGGGVNIGPDGQRLPEASQITAAYGANDTVELRVLNLRSDGAAPTESGIYLSPAGEFAVEDGRRGGDLDFNDGDYLQVSDGQGAAQLLAQSDSISIETKVRETALAPELRTEEIIETDIVETVVSSDGVAIEERDWGQVELAGNRPSVQPLGHATGAVSENNEQLVYSRYSGNSEIRAGSDGLSLTGQLKPLVDNPNVPPTLLSGNLGFNPLLGDNTASVTGSLGINQFLNPTHRLVTDAAGNVINNPNADGAPLVEPTGLFNNRRLVGYVPTVSQQSVSGAQLLPTNGIFELPADQAIVISPVDSQAVGPGNAAYTDNVGGLLIERATGELSFLTQWTKDGYAEDSLSLEAGEAVRAIYALVPQQPGQALMLGESYDVMAGVDGYEIAAGGFSIIAADRQPENFVAETSTIYAVEDTTPGNNAANELFNGIQGTYVQEPGAASVPTVDVNLMSEADARLGNTLFPLETVAANPGQGAYAQTTRAAGLYLGGSLTGGIGNQRDTVRQIDVQMDSIASELLTQRTTNVFMTPIMQRDTVVQQRTETTQDSSMAFFDIDFSGEVTNVRFVEGDQEVMSVDERVLSSDRKIIKGEEVQVSSETQTRLESLGSEQVESDRTSTENTDSYANLSAVQGELTFGGLLNFGNTPWTSAANTVRTELFAQDTVMGRGDGGIETGWRAEVLFHPFGEVRSEAYQYDSEGNAVPLYQTQPVLDANGQRQMEAITGVNGDLVNVQVNQFVIDEAGDRIAQTVGTGEAKGPGIYLRAEDAFGDSESMIVAGGFQLSF